MARLMLIINKNIERRKICMKIVSGERDCYPLPALICRKIQLLATDHALRNSATKIL